MWTDAIESNTDADVSVQVGMSVNVDTCREDKEDRMDVSSEKGHH